ncbi:MAG: hypothetical protein FWF60_05320 [Oscillospiraceae bacterium]|nr:hypothetical protein [Oscillospiraceae bacterium]MCL1952231.1 hypothetical protein [Oscillospiraceae bacterium]
MCRKAARPRIVSKRFRLVGAESKIEFGSDFEPVLQALRQTVLEGFGYKWLAKSRAYEPNEAVRGDLEVYANLTDTAPDSPAEIYIPIKQTKK